MKSPSEKCAIQIDGGFLKVRGVISKKIPKHVHCCIDGFVVKGGMVIQEGTITYKPRLNSDGPTFEITNCVFN